MIKHDVLTFPVELRSRQEGEESRKIVGRPAVYNQLSEDLGGFREKINPGAFTKTLSESNVKALWNHDNNYVLGSRKAGTLSIIEDSDGLSFEASPPDTQWARDFMLSVERGDVDQMSFRFRTIRDKWIKDENNRLVRELVEVQLIEVSPVTFPAYPQTSVDLRSMGLDFDPEELQDLTLRSVSGDISEEERQKLERIGSKIEELTAPATSHPEESKRSEADCNYTEREKMLGMLM
jgi:hypothetical protein